MAIIGSYEVREGDGIPASTTTSTREVIWDPWSSETNYATNTTSVGKVLNDKYEDQSITVTITPAASYIYWTIYADDNTLPPGRYYIVIEVTTTDGHGSVEGWYQLTVLNQGIS